MTLKIKKFVKNEIQLGNYVTEAENLIFVDCGYF